MAEKVDISTFTAHSILTQDLAIKTVVENIVPKLLAVEQTFLMKNHTPVVCQLPYSPDLAPCDFWLFPKLKGKQFQTREDIMTVIKADLNTIPKEAFSECFQQW